MRGQCFSLEVKLVCSFVSQICVQTLLQLESSSLIVAQIEGRSTILFHAAFQDESSSGNMGDKVRTSRPSVARVHPSCPCSKTCASPDAELSGLISALLGDQGEPCASWVPQLDGSTGITCEKTAWLLSTLQMLSLQLINLNERALVGITAEVFCFSFQFCSFSPIIMQPFHPQAHLPHVKVHAYFAPVTPPPSVGGSGQRLCRCCIIL